MTEMDTASFCWLITSGVCTDIDECQEEDVCTSVQGSVCSNTIGSYSCQCPEGQMEENAVCIDKPPGQ